MKNLKVLLQYLFGYIRVRIEGFFVERVINKAMSRKISFWHIKRDKATIVYANVGLRDYKELSKIVEENRCKMEKLKESGFPILIEKYRKRKIFFIMLFIVFLILIGSSNFVWNIQIEGAQTIDEEQFMKELNDNGLKIGMLKRKIDKEDIINSIRLNRNDISWIGISISRHKCYRKSCRSGIKTRSYR